MISRFAGEDFRVRLELDAPTKGKIGEVVTAARLVAPAFSLGNAFADVKTIPIQERKRYLVERDGKTALDHVRFLADYEKAKPGAFPLRDEEVVLESGRKAWSAKVAGNRFPGVYRIAVYVEGTIKLPYGECCHEGPQRFSRVLHTEVALGIRPDPKASRPVLFWTAPDRFVLSVTPTDKLGNVALPASALPAAVRVNGKPVTGTPETTTTGEPRIAFALRGEGRGPKEDGRTLSAAASIVDAEGKRQAEIAANKKPEIEITVGPTTMPVELPELVGDRASRRAFPAGSAEAMRIALDDREPLADKREARQKGFDV